MASAQCRFPVAFTAGRALHLAVRLNAPNLLTLSRIPAMFLIAWLVGQDWTGSASLAFWLFIAAAVGDALDGYLARKMNQITNFGKLMDALTDKIMVLGLVMVLVERHEIPLALALLTLCRELLVTGMRMVAATKGVVVPADRGGKSKTLTQLIALGFLLGAPMARQDWSRLFACDLSSFADRVGQTGQVIFAIGTGLAIWSGTRYIMRHGRLVFGEES